MCSGDEVEGSKPRGLGAGFKLFYHGVDERNGVGAVLQEEECQECSRGQTE